MTSWLRDWYHRDQDEKKMLRVNLEIILINLLNTKAVIGRETKDSEREDYVGKVWEGIQMANNGTKKGVSMVLQAKEGLE